MSFIDWFLVAIPMLSLLAIGIYTNRYTKSVADFLSGGRVARRYLLTVSRGEIGSGAVVYVAIFEIIAASGFTLTWWGWLSAPVAMLVALTGYVIYRYRETRAMTLAQFFEIRYSKSFRIFTGLLGFLAGLLNFSIIPVIEARFLTYFLRLPATFHFYYYVIPTYIPLMGLLLSLTLFLVLSGGFITLMITNCLEGVIAQVLGLVIVVWLIFTFHWNQISQVLTDQPSGKSLINPFDSMGLQDFNPWYVLIGLFGTLYGTMAWQNQSGYNSAAISPHESRMANLLGTWRAVGMGAIITLLAVCAMTYLHHPDFSAQSRVAHSQISQIQDPKLQRQMTLPIAVVNLLPNGLRGALCIILLMGIFGGGGNHLHSWGSLFIQDVLIPLRGKILPPKEHIRMLRWSMVGVAVFSFIFGILFKQTEYIIMWWQVTTSIYVGGAGAAIVGGLYWKKGTTAGAWTALIAGSGLSTTGIILRQIYGDAFPINGLQIGFYSTLFALTLYVVVSLLTCEENFNLERMLHRGKYSLQDKTGLKAKSNKFSWMGLVGIDNEFTVGDKWIAGSLFGWTLLWLAVFTMGSVWNLLSPWSNHVWSMFWHLVGIGIPVFVCAVTSVWFSWGGLKDTRQLLALLRTEKINALDNGIVVGHLNLDEAAKEGSRIPIPHPEPLELDPRKNETSSLAPQAFKSEGPKR
jgi:SSS family solute:Na+ symporter